MNHLNFAVEWDKVVPFEMRNRDLSETHPGINIQDGITVSVGFEEPVNGFKEEYRGTLTSAQSVRGYIAHIIWHFAGHDTKLVTTMDEPISPRDSKYKIKFDFEGEETKILSVPFRRAPEKAQTVAGYLNDLEGRKFVVARGEQVNECDYWFGFFGTSNGIWSHSLYKEANVGERALQLAYEIETGIRKGKGWFFPGPIRIDKPRLRKGESVIRAELNRIFMENHNLEHRTDFVVSRLRECAKRYQSLKG